jgi:hypothetical protein
MKDEIRLEVEELEERAAPAVLANPAALPPGNPGTSTALAQAPADAKATFTPLWFGKAAGRD